MVVKIFTTEFSTTSLVATGSRADGAGLGSAARATAAVKEMINKAAVSVRVERVTLGMMARADWEAAPKASAIYAGSLEFAQIGALG
jgi:hypothetical protein